MAAPGEELIVGIHAPDNTDTSLVRRRPVGPGLNVVQHFTTCGDDPQTGEDRHVEGVGRRIGTTSPVG
jgi:hypothetical protein